MDGQNRKSPRKSGEETWESCRGNFLAYLWSNTTSRQKNKKGFDEVVEWVEDKLEKAGKIVGKVVDKISSTIKKIFNSLSKSVKKSMELFTEYVIEPVDSVRKKSLKQLVT